MLPSAKPDKPEDAPKAFGELIPKLTAVAAKFGPVWKKFGEIGAKYGLDVSKVAPGK